VIVPTYNRPEFLERALRTIQAQTHQDYEIIVVNDAGIPVWDVVKQFPKTTLIDHVENKGLAGSRNTGLEAATGEYITFLDDDDILFPIHFQVLVYELDRGTKAAYTDGYRWENEQYLRRTLSADYSLDRLQAGCPFYVMCIMLRKEVLNGRRFDESLPSHEDYDMWLTLAEDGVKFKHLPFITAAYSQRGDGSQISHKPYHMNYFNYVREKHEINSVVPIWQRPPVKKICRYVVLQPFTGNIFGQCRSLELGKILDIDSETGSDYERAGYVRRVDE